MSERALFAGLLGLFVALAATYSALIPLGEAADEVSHHSYVRYVAEYGALPPAIEGTTVFGETFQPPLYYALAAPLTLWLPTGPESNLGFDFPLENNPDSELRVNERGRILLQPARARWPWRGEALGWHLVRLLSVALGAITVWATWRLSRRVFPGERATALLATAFVALLPSFVGLSAAVTNDALLVLLSALLLLQLARLVERPGGWRGWALVGLLGALTVWTKASGWVNAGTVVVAALLAGGSSRGVARRLLVAGGIWGLASLPLLGINLARSGDLLGRGLQARVTDARSSLDTLEFLRVVAGLYRTWWAGFGGAVHLSLPGTLNALLLILLLVAGIGLLRRHRARGSSPTLTRRLVPLLAAHIILLLAAWLGWTRLVLGTGQGRLLFPALPAVGTLVAGGVIAVAPRALWGTGRVARPWFAGLLALQLVVFSAILLPVYRAPAPRAAPPEAAEIATSRWQVGDQSLALTGFYLPLTIDDRPGAGSATRLWLAWESTAPLPDLRVRLRWLDRDGASRWVKEGSPVAAHPLTDEWAPGRYAAWHRIPIPPEFEPGWYRLMLSVIEPTTGEPLQLHPAGDEIMVGQITVAE